MAIFPNAGIKQWPGEGKNTIFTNNQGSAGETLITLIFVIKVSPAEPLITKTNGEKKKRGREGS